MTDRTHSGDAGTLTPEQSRHLSYLLATFPHLNLGRALARARQYGLPEPTPPWPVDPRAPKIGQFNG